MTTIIKPVSCRPSELMLERQDFESSLQSFRFAWISDTHYSPYSQLNEYGVDPHVRTERVLEQVAEFDRSHAPLAAVVHTGDVNDKEYRNSRSYQSFDRMIESLDLPPAFYVAGNHDSPERMSDLLAFGKRIEEFQDRNSICYQFELAGVECFVLDGRIDTGARGRVPEEQVEWLEEKLRGLSEGERAFIFLHFPLFEKSSGWVQDEMLVENGERIHQRLVPFRDRILAVLHGHVHASRQTVRDGILYASAPSASYAFDVDHPGGSWIPADMVDHDGLTGFTIVDVEVGKDEASVVIRQRSPHRDQK